MLHRFRSQFVGGLATGSAATRKLHGRGKRAVRLLVEGLEDRTVLSSGSPGIGSLLSAVPFSAMGAAAPVLGSGQESADTGFLQNAATGNIQEILLGALATQLATNSDTVAFGQKLMSDHTTALIADALILQAEGVGMPALSLEQMQFVRQFATRTPAAFDAQFASLMAMDHQQDIANYQNEIANGNDPVVRAYALMTLPALEQHLQIATTLQAEYGNGQSSNSDQNSPAEGSADAAFLQ